MSEREKECATRLLTTFSKLSSRNQERLTDIATGMVLVREDEQTEADAVLLKAEEPASAEAGG